MRRIALILTLIAGSVAGLAASASGGDSHVYFIEMDNAFGLVTGSPVKVAGVEAGTITDLYINSQKRAVARVELSGPVAVLGEDTICSTQPQSLIAEYFIDCSPKGPPIEEGTGSDDDRSEHPDIPVEQTQQTVQNDLVLSAMRMPFRDRLRLLINEFGTALAGNSDNLNDAIRRGAPALRETQQVFHLLAQQNTMIRDLNVDSDKIIGELAKRREQVTRFIKETNETAAASAERRDDLSQNFALLDDFLAQLKPTMVDLNGLAVQSTPLLSDLRQAAPGLNTLSRNLPDFNPAATDSLVSLGKSAVVGQRALSEGRDEIAQLGETAKNSFPVADNLAKFLRDIDDPNRAVETDTRANRDTGRKGETGYTGLEGLLNYVYYQPGAINQYDEIGHLLHFSIFEVGSGPCASYNAGEYDPDGPGPEAPQHGVPNLDGSAATTDVTQANRCVAWLGDNQPGLNTGPNLPPYDGSVCPAGSTDTSICDPSSHLRAEGKKQVEVTPGSGDSGNGAPNTGAPDTGDTGDGTGSGITGNGDEGQGETPGQPAPPVGDGVGIPGLDGVLGGPEGGGVLGKQRRHKGIRAASAANDSAASANQDLLGYLFGN
jgi:ABC-type transporter Mla subunit MlaD